MKKYQQLLLAILSIVSFSCLLIYRHEYNKLRYVLEVLNFFGTPGVSTSSPLVCSLNGTFSKFPVTAGDPLPAWQRVSNSLYIYSAYWEEADDKEHVKAFAVGVLNENLNYGCDLWYDSYPKTKTGQFSFSGIQYKSTDPIYNKNFGKSRMKGFVFYCTPEKGGITPVGVTFYKRSVNESSQGFLPVVNLKLSYPAQNSTGVCVMPTPFSNLNRSTYLEFLSFHKVIGVNGFLVYGSNDQYNLLSSIQKDSSNKIDLTIMQWNYPFYGDNELMKVIAENDCKTRTISLFENVLILEWNKFFVPRYLFSVSKILNELDTKKKTYKFQFSTLLFCTEYNDNMKANSSTPFVLRKTKYAFPKVDLMVPAYRSYLRTGRVQKVGKDIVAVQQYTSCRDFKIKSGEKKTEKVDTSIYRFQDEFLNSKLLLMNRNEEESKINNI